MSRARREDPQFLPQRRFGLALAAFGGTRFNGANLTSAVFTGARTDNTNFAGANLKHTVFRGARGLKGAHSGKTILREPKIRELLVNGQGANGDYSHADLHGANLDKADLTHAQLDFADLSGASLRGADLSHAALSQAQCLGADFSGAILTGACLEAWNIDSTTVLDDVQADYVYLLRNQEERRPASGAFAPGEFSKFFQEVLDTVDLIFHEGMDWKAFLISFKNVKVAIGDSGEEVNVQGIENKGDGTFVVRLNVPRGIDKEAVHSGFTQEYQHQFQLLETEYRARLIAKDERMEDFKKQNTDLQQIIQTLAERPVQITMEKNVMSKTHQGDDINLSGSTFSNSVVTVKSRLDNVTQTIGSLPNTGAEEKAKLEDLVKQLSEALSQVPEDKAQEAERVSKMTERTVEDAKSGDKSMFEVSAKGLKEAAEALAGIVPTAVGIVKQIVEVLRVYA